GAESLGRIGGSVCWLPYESRTISLPDQARALIGGTIIGGYTPGRWKTQELEKRPRPVERIVLGHVETPELRAAAERAALLAERTNRARDLANMPPNELNPEALAEAARALADEHEHLAVEVFGPEEMDELGIGALAALGVPVRALAVLAAAENLPDGNAFRPGDILRAANGKTIEIVNTDAEGRLVLADALWYARREGATHVIDLATLTGAMELALGDLYAGFFANDDAWRDRIVAAGERSGDLVWAFPLHP